MSIPIFDELNVQTLEGVLADISQIRGAPKFKLTGDAIEDKGGVGTAYTLNTKDLTPTTPASISGDVVIFSTTKSSYLAKVNSADSTNVEVTVVEALGSSSSAGYDTIISNQEEFEAWYAELDAGTYEGESVLILSGTYTRDDGNGLHFPDTLKQVCGLGNVQIKISNFKDNNSGKGGIWYTVLPENEQYFIKNIDVIISAGDQGYGILPAFIKCKNLINCVGESNSSSSGYSPCSFQECVNLINCIGKSTYSTDVVGIAYGFFKCTNLINCTCNTSARGGSSRSFAVCKYLISCTGSAIGKNNSYTFSDCNICSNCHQDLDNASTTATWGGNNTNVDPNTCPEYTGSYNTAIPITDLRGVN